jgi:lipopolysaccharide/colanic/teichoic acid biosynthesis glycosyltransferase
MSLVGTRPPTVEEVKRYEQHHWERLKVKPGMTREWQVNGRSHIKEFEAIVEMDLNYQRQWSILYDINLILKTIQVVLDRNGAC